MPTYAFANGSTGLQGYGDRWVITFSGTWLVGDTWSVDVASTEGRFILGQGEFQGQAMTSCFTFKGRVYVANDSKINFSDNDSATAWEIQNPGAGDITYLSQYGSQDTVVGFGQLQGRLVVFGKRSVQIWTVDADPNNFALVQTLDNLGTKAPLSIQNLGDYDLVFLDYTGFRSMRAMEVTLNAVLDDVGTQVDELVLAGMSSDAITSAACGVVDPATRDYWCYLNGVIYVLSRHPNSKISAWSTFDCYATDGTTFTPKKFVVYLGQIFCRSTERKHVTYGGWNNKTYDTGVTGQVTLVSPPTDDKRPDVMKHGTGINAVLKGVWAIYVAMDPKSAFPANPIYAGEATVNAPDAAQDSTYDIGRVAYNENGTHFAFKAVSANKTPDAPAVFSSFVFHYNQGNVL